MSEVLTTPEIGGSVEAPTPATTPEVQAAGRFERLRQFGKNVYSLVDLGAGVALAEQRLRGAGDAVTAINDQYEGMPARRMDGETVSMQLEASIAITFRRDAQRAGYADIDTMPAHLRVAVAELAARSHDADIVEELYTANPGWTAEELAAAAELRIADIARLLGMTTTERDDYNQDMVRFQTSRESLPQIHTELQDLRQEYRQQARTVGRAAVASLVSLAGVVRSLPAFAGSHAVAAVAGVAHRARNWYGEKSTEQKRVVIFSAASVALAGIASYIAMRYSGVGHTQAGGNNMTPVGFTSTDHSPNGTTFGGTTSAGEVFGGAPAGGETFGGHDTTGEVFGGGSSGATFGGVSGGETFGGGQTAGGIFGGDTAGETFGGTPVGGEVFGGAGGEDLSWATTTHDLFTGNTPVSTWPETLTVTPWDATNHDGSLTGVSEALWHRSGVEHPTAKQINELVDALRPQAQPNGYLLEGQELDLRPAISLLPSVS